MAANNGVSDRVFQRHGRWKSVQAKDTYVDDDLKTFCLQIPWALNYVSP